MSNTIDFNSIDDYEIEIERSPEFLQTAVAVGNYIKTLPLTAEQNDTLVELMVTHVNVAEESGCKFGMDLGVKIGLAKAGGEFDD